MTVADSVVQALTSQGPMSDAALAKTLAVKHQQVNQACRLLAGQGRLIRDQGEGVILNRLPGQRAPAIQAVPSGNDAVLTEDQVKLAVGEYLEQRGYEVEIMWGKARGIDIDARSDTGRIVIEAKGQVDPARPNFHQIQGNYFLNALGELIQRIDDSEAEYALALPDEARSRGLVDRLPELARERLRLKVFFVSKTDEGLAVRER